MAPVNLATTPLNSMTAVEFKKKWSRRCPRLEPRDADYAAKLKERMLTNLYSKRPAWLNLAHKTLDAAGAAAYDWSANMTDEQILEKLLALNLERAERNPKPRK